MRFMRVSVRDAVPSDAAVTAALLTELGDPVPIEIATDRLAQARRQGCPRLDLGTPMELTDAHAFYERLGFEDVNRAYRRLLQRS
jgi:GNAT superfamily N-acetyltransferase